MMYVITFGERASRPGYTRLRWNRQQLRIGLVYGEFTMRLK